MLVLSRKKGQKLVLQITQVALPGGEVVEIKPIDITVCAVEIMSSHTVRLGIEAADDIKIYRKELLDGFAT